MWFILVAFSFLALQSGGESMCSLQVLPGIFEPRVPRFSLHACPWYSWNLSRSCFCSFFHADNWAADSLVLWALTGLWTKRWLWFLCPLFQICLSSMCLPCLWFLFKLHVGAAWQRLLLRDSWAQEPFWKHCESWTGRSKATCKYLLYEVQGFARGSTFPAFNCSVAL